jgi:predicted transcriptional regulator of viral defense system
MLSQSRSLTARVKAIFLRRHGMLRTAEALREGIHPRMLYKLRQEGALVEVSRGLYRLADLPPMGDPDLATIAAKVPAGVVCLISALAWHELTIQVPHEIHLALPKDHKAPRLAYPPLRIFHYDLKSFREGITVEELDGVPVRIFNPEKTLADCFKFRNKIGLDAALEALKTYMRRRTKNLDALQRYARVCRVDRVMRPYLEALL